MQFPHCDMRILHAPGECRYCDEHPDWQELRKMWGIAFTGHREGMIRDYHFSGPEGISASRRSYLAPPYEFGLPCPADFARPPASESDHRRWAGNVATTEEPVDETDASKLLYGFMTHKEAREAGVHPDQFPPYTVEQPKVGWLARLRRLVRG